MDEPNYFDTCRCRQMNQKFLAYLLTSDLSWSLHAGSYIAFARTS